MKNGADGSVFHSPPFVEEPSGTGQGQRRRSFTLIILVMDNLNTYKAISLYKAFPPAEAKRNIKRLEINYIPKHGSWLDMAEIELNVIFYFDAICSG